MLQRIAIDVLGIEPATSFLDEVVGSIPGLAVDKIDQLGGAWPEGLLLRVQLQVPRGPEHYQRLLDALTTLDRWYRANAWNDFRVYESGVRYQAEPFGEEIWQSIPALSIRRVGDCEDLAAARASEIEGGAAKIISTGESIGGGRLYHVVVERKGGRTEDPSRKLGMT